MIETYPDDSINAQAILLAVETGIEPQVWIDLGIVGMNTATKYLEAKIKREASYFGARVRGDDSAKADSGGRQMSG
jgi:hypothetical protein